MHWEERKISFFGAEETRQSLTRRRRTLRKDLLSQIKTFFSLPTNLRSLT